MNKRWKRPPPTRRNKIPNVLTRKQTEKARLQSEKKTAEAALKMQMKKASSRDWRRRKGGRQAESSQRSYERKQRQNNVNYKLQ